MKTKDLEKRTAQLAPKYKPAPRRLEYEPDIPIRKLQYAILLTGLGTVISGAALAYAMFPDTIANIVNYFTQRPF